ncbi:hypothetical protein MW887_010477 [Aspergillus wentii]|nr:hypothetical protein MW887_010477 [Aspergillus wentii]
MDMLLSRLVFPWADVVCLFADDLGGLEGVRTMLASLSLAGPVATVRVFPRVLVVTETAEVRIAHGLQDEDTFVQDVMRDPKVSEAFSSVHLLHLPGATDLSEEARHRCLKEAVLKGLDLSQRARRDEFTLFTSSHLEALFGAGIQHLGQTIQAPFDVIGAAYQNPQGLHLPAPEDRTQHLAHFLTQAKAVPLDIQNAIIASTLLEESFPLGMHDFAPVKLFHRMHRDICVQALQQIATVPDVADKRCTEIAILFAIFHEQMIQCGCSAQDVHAEQLGRWQPIWEGLNTNRTCLYCLGRAPQSPLRCGHALCDICVERTGHPVASRESIYIVKKCPLCRHPGLTTISLLPKTAAVRALTVDGGGIRGIIPLQLLKEMQDRLGPDCPFPDLIDVAFGTSAAFLRFFVEFFHAQQQEHVRVVPSWPLRAVRGVLGLGMYAVGALESMLRQHYGTTQRMFEVSSCSFGTKVAVTTAATESAALVTNYRAARRRPPASARVNKKRWDAYAESHYQVIEAAALCDEPLIWQSARATSAAPWFFRAMHLPPLGNCWDGTQSHMAMETSSGYPIVSRDRDFRERGAAGQTGNVPRAPSPTGGFRAKNV